MATPKFVRHYKLASKSQKGVHSIIELKTTFNAIWHQDKLISILSFLSNRGYWTDRKKNHQINVSDISTIKKKKKNIYAKKMKIFE